MNGRLILTLSSISLVGFLGGLIARQVRGDENPDGAKDHRSPKLGQRVDVASTKARGEQGKMRTIPRVQSSDTAEDLLKLPPEALFSRLALWLLDAKEGEISALWRELARREDVDYTISQIVFVVWTKLNPQAAIKTATETDSAEAAWWGWASHSPDSALAAAISDGGRENLVAVMEALGECHPAWVLAHYDELPEQEREYALLGLEVLGEGGDPSEILNFLLEKGSEGSEAMLRRLVRDDPEAALRWAREADGRFRPGPFDGEGNDQLLAVAEHLERLHPDLLRELRDDEPAGAVRRVMDRLLFERLAREDMESAVQKARETKAPRVALERWGKIGLALVDRDPERAFDVLEEMLSVTPHIFSYGNEVHYPHGASGQGFSNEDAQVLTERLLQIDPARLLRARPDGDSEWGDDWDDLVTAWARMDLDGFQDFVVQERESERSREYEKVMLERLTQQGRVDEALEYVQGLGNGRMGALHGVIDQWKNFAWEDAKAWVEEAEMTPEERVRLLSLVRSDQ